MTTITKKHTIPESPRLLMLHGFGGAGSDWQDMCQHLPQDYNIHCLDFPAHAGEPSLQDLQIATPLDLAHWMADRAREIFTSPFYLCGYSMGGRIAALMTKYIAAEQIRGLLLISSSMGIEDLQERYARDLADQAWSRLLKENPEKFWADWYQQPVFSSLRDSHSQLKQSWIPQKQQQNSHRLAEFLCAISVSRHEPLWAEILSCERFLYISGILDKKYQELGTRILAKHTSAVVKNIPSSGHVVIKENPKACAQAIQEWVEKNAARNKSQKNLTSRYSLENPRDLL